MHCPCLLLTQSIGPLSARVKKLIRSLVSAGQPYETRIICPVVIGLWRARPLSGRGGIRGRHKGHDLGRVFGVYSELSPAFERTSGHRLVTTRGPSMGDSPEAIPTRLARGEI